MKSQSLLRNLLEEIESIKQQLDSDGPGYAFSPTRWTVCANALQSILANYEALLKL